MNIYRKLKHYMYEDPGDDEHCGSTTSIFGTLRESRNIYNYQDPETNEYVDWSCKGFYYHEKEFLLDYYVIGIFPIYEIVNNTIVAKLKICLSKEKPEL